MTCLGTRRLFWGPSSMLEYYLTLIVVLAVLVVSRLSRLVLYLSTSAVSTSASSGLQDVMHVLLLCSYASCGVNLILCLIRRYLIESFSNVPELWWDMFRSEGNRPFTNHLINEVPNRNSTTKLTTTTETTPTLESSGLTCSDIVPTALTS